MHSDLTREDRIAMLRRQHADLEADIADEQRRPMPDQSLLSCYKRRKFRIKEELERAQSRTRVDSYS